MAMQERQTSQLNLNFLRSVSARITFMIVFIVAMLAVVLAVNTFNTNRVSGDLERLQSLRAPTIVASSGAENEMLTMLINIRAYLALGESEFIGDYEDARNRFEEHLATLDTLSPNWTNDENKTRLEQIKEVYETWKVLPQQMFDLRDDPLANQPAQNILVSQGAPRIATVLGDITIMIDIQAEREPSETNTQILKDMADFRGSWNGMAAGIRGYLANLNPLFLTEYETALTTNNDAWNRLISHPRSSFTSEQLTALDEIVSVREAFLVFPQQMFDAATSERAREDLYLLSTQAVPEAATIVDTLELMVIDQQGLLLGDINLSNNIMIVGQQVSLGMGAVVLVVSTVLAFITITNITRSLNIVTNAARAIASGNRDIHVDIRSQDELGLLGRTFNAMVDELDTAYTTLESRARDIQTVVDVSGQISTILDMNRLLQDVVDVTKERFGLYHAHVYLMDEDEQHLTLTAGAGHVGRQMVSERRIINANSRQSIVATAARDRRSQVVNNVTLSPSFLAHPLLPDTKSELAVPLVARGRVLGTLDVQSDEVDYFDEATLEVLEIMASQVATALSNAALYQQAEQSSRHEQALSAIDQEIQNAVGLDEMLQTTVRELGKALRVAHTAIELDMTPDQTNGTKNEEVSNV